MTDPSPEGDDFLAELRRRKVFRVLVAYGAAAFVLLQAADLTLEPLGAPAWVYRVLVVLTILGLPVALLLAWAYDVTERGVVRTSRSGSAPDESQVRAGTPRLRRNAIVAICVLAALAISGAAYFWFDSAESSETSVAVLPFTVRGNPQLAYLKDGMVDLLSRNLDGVAEIRTIAPEMVLTATAKSAAAPDPTRASEIAARLGAGMYVLGSVTQAGRSIRIDAALYDRFASDPLEPQSSYVVGAPDDLLSLVDRLSADLLASTRRGHSARFARMAALTSSSLPALREYLDGEAHLRAARYDSAVARFQSAVAADTAFALAYYRLAVAASAQGAFRPAHDAISQLGKYADRLSDRDRALSDAFVAADRGDIEDAERRYEAILERYPDDMEATYQLGSLKFEYNPSRGRSISEAKSYLEKVLADDPQFLCPI